MSAQGPTDRPAREAMDREAMDREAMDREILAGEFVLGMVDARTAAAVARALPSDTALRQAVEAWEDQLTGLADAIPQEAPPPELWDRIAACLPAEAGRAGVARGQQRATSDQSRGFAWLWRAWAVGATVATVVFAGIAVVQTQRHDTLEASLVRPTTDRGTPGQPAPMIAAPLPTAPAPVQQASPTPAPAGSQLSAPSAVAQSPPALASPTPGQVVLPATAPDASGMTRPASGGEGAAAGRPSPADGSGTIRR